MTERDRIPRTSDPTPPADPKRERAQAIHSVDDETRVHADADETDLVQGAGGDLRRPDTAEQGDAAPRTDEDENGDGDGDGENT